MRDEEDKEVTVFFAVYNCLTCTHLCLSTTKPPKRTVMMRNISCPLNDNLILLEDEFSSQEEAGIFSFNYSSKTTGGKD